MIDDRDLDRALEEWLAPAGDRLPERVIDAAVARAWTVKRARRLPWSRWMGERRGMPRPPAVLALAALVALASVGAIVAITGGPDADGPEPSTPVIVVPTPDPEDLAGAWLGVGRGTRETGGWALRLGDFATLQGPGSEFQILRGFEVTGDELRVPPGIGACADIAGVYRWRITGERLVIEVVDDPCADRSGPLTRYDWQRVPDGWSIGHRFRIPFITPVLEPAQSLQEVTTTLHGFGGYNVDGPTGLVVWIVEDVFDDACPPSGLDYAPSLVDAGTDALLERLRRMAAITLGEPVATVAAGRPAVRVRLTVTDPTCPRNTARLWEDRGEPVGMGDGVTHQFFELPFDGRADLFILDIHGTTVTLVAWAPSGEPTTPERQAVIDAMRFPDADP